MSGSLPITPTSRLKVRRLKPSCVLCTARLRSTLRPHATNPLGWQRSKLPFPAAPSLPMTLLHSARLGETPHFTFVPMTQPALRISYDVSASNATSAVRTQTAHSNEPVIGLL